MLAIEERGHSPIGLNGGLIAPDVLARPDSARPLVTTQAYYMNGIHTGVIRRLESLQRGNVVAGMLPNSISTRDRDGVVHRVNVLDKELLVGDIKIGDLEVLDSETSLAIGEDEPRHKRVVPGSFRQEDTSDLADSWTVPAKPYGDTHLMQVSFGDEPNFIDIKEPQLSWMLNDWSWFAQELRNEYGQVAIGANLSFPCLFDGKGLMSMLTVHNHVWTDPKMKGLNLEKILQGRALPWDNQPGVSGWDGGIARQIGDLLKVEIEEKILPHCGYRGRVESDDKGLVIELPDFEPQMIAEPQFLVFMRWNSWAVHNHLGDHHEVYFRSSFDDCVNFSIAAHGQGNTVDSGQYENLYMKKSLNGSTNGEVSMAQLDELHLLRKGFGWAWGIIFGQDGGAIAAITLGVVDREFGPVETLGMELKRIKEVLPAVEGEQKTQKYRLLADKYHRAHRYI